MKRIIIVLFSILFVSCGIASSSVSAEQKSNTTVVVASDTIRITLEKYQSFESIDWRTQPYDQDELWLTTSSLSGHTRTVVCRRVYYKSDKASKGADPVILIIEN